MRKTLLLLVCLSCLCSLSAQDDVEEGYAASPTIEVSGSINFAIYNKNDIKTYNIQRKILYSVGILQGCDWKIPHGVMMLQVGWLISNNDFLYGDGLTFKSLSFDIPIIVGYAYRINPNYSLSFSGGYVQKMFFKVSDGLTQDRSHISAYGLHGAIGFCYHASPHFTLRVEPFFEYLWIPAYQGSLNYMAPAIIGLRMALKCNILKLKQ